MKLVDDHASESATETIECERGGMSTTDLEKTRAAVETHIESMAVEIARLTAELADEKAVNEHQRSELQDRLQKQRAAEAELEEARKDAERYRFIRDADRSDALLPLSAIVAFAGADLDLAVDDAMALESP